MHSTSTLRPPARNIAADLARFAHALTLDDIPDRVWTQSIHHIVDAIGLAFASGHFPFAPPAIEGIRAAAGAGDATVIGQQLTLAPRDAALANGYLIHGLDFDDTHPESIVHPSVACLPAALALAEATHASWGQMIVAYAAGMETAIRLGRAVKGGFHRVGFHATGVVSHFSSAVVAGKLLGLSAEQIVAAQGIAASTAAGVQVFLEDGAWTKRMHPGWGALSGITAAYLARAGFAGPQRPYEGRFGLLDTHLQAHAADVDADSVGDALGTHWTLLDTSIKPYPVCHFIHGCAEAALRLRDRIGAAGGLDAIERIVCELPAATLPIVAEPPEKKLNPQSDYDAKFSVQFVVAACLARGRFTLAELEPATLADARILSIARKIECRADPESTFPTYFSGNVSIALANGETIRAEVPKNLGSGERALAREDIIGKFRGNVGAVRAPEHVEAVLHTLLDAGPDTPVRDVTHALK
ncbi:MmgE/PrpD family protein [Pararobbsia silviterrae]|uniref:MmgE/PrpD family protein n=1 Tax=Pararobbsia silviterrae TaxID=1792498 RepID=A0A494YAI5_9BURK|nr:MmgE/PrpD family protein [Pararobbsia silviterrae]RKP57645.1 MmgE/PrpD family protein [Pararobbsia silviterrae]